MAEAAAERVLKGIPASEGLALGTVTVDAWDRGGRRRAGAPSEERRALEHALEQAARELDTLMGQQDELAADILEFQRVLLEDEDLLAPVFRSIEAGVPADTAWREVLEREIADYQSGEDDVFSARAADLADLQARVGRALVGGAAPGGQGANEGAIVIAEDLAPSRFLELDWTRCRGAALIGGNRTSHVSLLARARGIPLLVGLTADLSDMQDGTPAVLDAEAGALILAPEAETLTAAEERIGMRSARLRELAPLLDRPALTPEGERVKVLINVDDPSLLDAVPVGHCDGIGLARTEFLFEGQALPGEDAQYEVYKRLLAWAGGRPVTIRTLDAGGDKPVAGLTVVGEKNPFLGVRGLRLSLLHPDAFRTQLRALVRAAAHGDLRIMVPMVTAPAEIAEARGHFDTVLDELGAQSSPPQFGMMVEVPAAAMTAEDFDADFYSIGSNDLVQYLTAATRDDSRLAKLADPANPAVAELIARTVEAAHRRGVDVSLCGDMASDPDLVGLLLDCGLRSLSVAPAQIGPVKHAIVHHRGGDAQS